jgi:hypothetical protein
MKQSFGDTYQSSLAKLTEKFPFPERSPNCTDPLKSPTFCLSCKNCWGGFGSGTALHMWKMKRSTGSTHHIPHPHGGWEGGTGEESFEILASWWAGGGVFCLKISLQSDKHQRFLELFVGWRG